MPCLADTARIAKQDWWEDLWCGVHCWCVAVSASTFYEIPSNLVKSKPKTFAGWNIWVFPKIGVPQNGWFIMENPIKNGWFGGTIIFGNTYIDIFAFVHLPSTKRLHIWGAQTEATNPSTRMRPPLDWRQEIMRNQSRKALRFRYKETKV